MNMAVKNQIPLGGKRDGRREILGADRHDHESTARRLLPACANGHRRQHELGVCNINQKMIFKTAPDE